MASNADSHGGLVAASTLAYVQGKSLFADNPLMRRLPITRSRFCIALAVLIFLVGVGDFAISLNRIPANPAPCPVNIRLGVPTNKCEDAFLAQDQAREARREQARADFNQRERFYGIAIAIALLLAVGFAYPPEQAARRRFFANVGSAGVALLLLPVGWGIWASHTAMQDAGGWGTLFPSFALLAVAALGGLANLSVPPSSRPPKARPRQSP
jgi:hypothetical protein